MIAHLGALVFGEDTDNLVFLGPPGTTTPLAIGISIRAACQAGHRVQIATAAELVGRLAAAHAAGHGPTTSCAASSATPAAHG